MRKANIENIDDNIYIGIDICGALNIQIFSLFPTYSETLKDFIISVKAQRPFNLNFDLFLERLKLKENKHC